MNSRNMSLFFSSRKAFTLVELLVVILIVALLVAVALPNFLGQQDKAKDSASQQYLAVAYKSARSEAVDRQGNFIEGGFNASSLASKIQASELQLSVDAGATCQELDQARPENILLDSSLTSEGLFVAYSKSASGVIWKITAGQNIQFSKVTNCDAAPLARIPVASADLNNNPLVGVADGCTNNGGGLAGFLSDINDDDENTCSSFYMRGPLNGIVPNMQPVVFDFGAAKTISSYKVALASNQFADIVVFEGSTNGTSWTALPAGQLTNSVTGPYKSASNVNASYRYIRMVYPLPSDLSQTYFNDYGFYYTLKSVEFYG